VSPPRVLSISIFDAFAYFSCAEVLVQTALLYRAARRGFFALLPLRYQNSRKTVSYVIIVRSKITLTTSVCPSSYGLVRRVLGVAAREPDSRGDDTVKLREMRLRLPVSPEAQHRGFEFWRHNAGSNDQARARSRRAANTPRGWRAPRHGATCQPKTRHPGDGPNDFDGRNSRNDFGKKNKSAHPPPPPHVPHQLWRRGSAHHRDVVPANFACPHVSSSVRD
jgi:hypothetical protein